MVKYFGVFLFFIAQISFSNDFKFIKTIQVEYIEYIKYKQTTTNLDLYIDDTNTLFLKMNCFYIGLKYTDLKKLYNLSNVVCNATLINSFDNDNAVYNDMIISASLFEKTLVINFFDYRYEYIDLQNKRNFYKKLCLFFTIYIYNENLIHIIYLNGG